MGGKGWPLAYPDFSDQSHRATRLSPLQWQTRVGGVPPHPPRALGVQAHAQGTEGQDFGDNCSSRGWCIVTGL